MPEEKVILYKHPIGQEMGLINLVVPTPHDPDDDPQVTLVMTSEYAIDEGVIFTVEVYEEIYEEMRVDYGVETLEGCILSTFGDQITIEEVPEDPPPKRPDATKKGNVRVLMTPNMWRHKWGRCCCVKRGDEQVAVTRETINEGKVPFWNSPYTPYELDMIDAARDPETRAMHVLLDGDLVCGKCGHNIWVVAPEDVPTDLPTPPQYIEVADPLCDDQKALDEISWATKSEAWEIFYTDDHNHKAVQDCKLAIERANNRKRYSQEKQFEPFNRAHGLGKNIYTVKQAFYAALGSARSGTWADFDLGMLRLVKGLEDIDVPAEILDMVRLQDSSAQAEMQGKVEQRATKATVDEEATILQFMLDDEATDDDNDDGLNDSDFEDVPEVVEPKRQRPKAIPRVRKPRVEVTERQRPQKRTPATNTKKTAAKAALVTACTQMQKALTAFVEVLQDDDEEEDESNNGSNQAGG